MTGRSGPLGNANVLNALQMALDRPGPYSSEELAAVEKITVTGEISCDFDYLPSLRDVRNYEGAESLDWLSVAPRGQIERISIYDTPNIALSTLSEQPQLKSVRVERCSVTDLSPLLGMSRLVAIYSSGNPWSEKSFFETAEELRRRGAHVELEPEAEWRVTRKLFESGIDGYYENGWLTIRQPNSASGATLDFRIDEAESLEIVSRDFTLEELEQRSLYKPPTPIAATEPVPVPPAERELGDAVAARSWVNAASIGRAEKTKMLRFIRRFESRHFERFTPHFFASFPFLKEIGKPLHKAVRDGFGTLIGAVSPTRKNEAFEVHLGLKQASGLHVTDEDFWVLGWCTMRGAHRPGLHPVARCSNDYMLVYDERSRGIGVIDAELLYDDDEFIEAVDVIYESYADLLDDVVAMRPPGERLIRPN